MSILDKIKDLGRLDHIINVLFKYELGFFLEKLHIKDRLTLQQRLQKEKFIERKTQPIILRKVFEEIGGSFIKLGQFLSVRPDIIPIEYVKEFEKLQDNIPPITFEEVRKILELELKKPVSGIFKEFTQEPLASASIAQVHRAKLITGEEVAVKIQRPKINELMERDIDIMFWFADLMQNHNHQIKGVNPRLIVDEFKQWTEKELDFEQEALNMQVFENNFAKDKNIVIPKVYTDLSTKKVLTMSFVQGIPLNHFEKIKEKRYDIDKLVTIGFNSILKQIFVHGFFHADPHPGNIIVVNNEKISFVDFGIVGIFNEAMRQQATNIFCGIIRDDIDQVINTIIEMGVDSNNIDILKIELESKIKIIEGKKIEDVVLSKVLEDVLSIIQKHGFKLPIEFVLFGKSIMTLEGVALRYDPKFRITVQSKPFVEKMIREKTNPKKVMQNIIATTSKLKDFTVSIPEKTTALLKRMKETDISLRYIDRDMRGLMVEMDKSSNRITLGLIITALIIASTITLSYDQIKILKISAFSFIGYSISAVLIIIVAISIFMEKRGVK